MKTQLSIWLCSLLFIQASAQSTKSAYEQIGLSTDKTSSLVFPSMIRYVDRGSPEILTEPVGEAPNILLIKARKSCFQTTSLNVITSDGRIYCFIMHYDSLPPQLIHYVSTEDVGITSQDTRTITDLQTKLLTDALQYHNPVGRTRSARSWGISARLVGVFTKQNLLFVSLQLRNYSSLPYELDQIRFYIKEPARSKRTAQQEKAMTPVYLSVKPLSVQQNSQGHISVAFPQFTLPAGKKFFISICEKEGGRDLQLRLTNRDLVHAVLLP
ncbi:MAG: conjugative transposon protein TraN [Flavisolibacter sp.]